MKEGFSVDIRIDVDCQKCGSENVTIPETEGSLDAIVCNRCGANNGTRAALDDQIRKKVTKQVRDDHQSIMRNAFKGMKDFEVKVKF